jgi:VanZ family protein|tara:strand:- start:3892 stop:4254 length:363 start_codon:yes stop_codon:yes gene_type:complete
MQKNKKYFIWDILSWFFLALVIILSLIPMPIDSSYDYSYIHLDKLAHFLSYALLLVLFSKVYIPRFYLKISLLLFFLGVLLEIIQNYISYRAFDINDLLANTFGIMLGILVSKYIISNPI